jgi:tetratricopeptide (TPR) repeat protein
MVCCLLVSAVGCGSGEFKLDPEANYFVQAQAALEQGTIDEALDLLSKSIEVKPQAYAHYQRARIYVDREEDSLAIDDCKRGLELEPENRDLQWLLGELQKPKNSRFKGKFKDPPGASK